MKIFNSYNDLVWAIAHSMPDEYPEGVALTFADQGLKNGDFKIKNDTGDRSCYLDKDWKHDTKRKTR